MARALFIWKMIDLGLLRVLTIGDADEDLLLWSFLVGLVGFGYDVYAFT